MATVRRRLALANPPRMAEPASAGLDAMTEEEIERAAAADPDNPPWTADELERGVMARRIRRLREATGLSQTKFAERFKINPARLRDWEQGRFRPDSVAEAYLTVIERERKAVERALSKVS